MSPASFGPPHDPPRPAAARLAPAALWGMMLGVVALYALLRYALGLAGADAVTLTVLLGVVPALTLAQAPLLDELEIRRVPAYWSSALALWIIGTAAWAVGTRTGGAHAVGLRAMGPGSMVSWTVVLTAGGLGIIELFRRIGLALGLTESRTLLALMPRTPEERGAFVVLSLAAGVGEEVAYRGYALGVLVPVIGAPVAVAVTSVVFGLMHLYQGRLGVVRTTLMGAMMAWGFLASGSLLPVMAAHVLIDVLAGIVLAQRLLLPPPTPVDGPAPYRDDPWKST